MRALVRRASDGRGRTRVRKGRIGSTRGGGPSGGRGSCQAGVVASGLAARVGIDLGRASRRWRVTCPALSVARRVHISTIAAFPEAPRFIPDGRISRVRLAAPACPHADLPGCDSNGGEAQALARIHPCRRRFVRGLVPRSVGRRCPGQWPDAVRRRGTARCRELLRPFEVLPLRGRPHGPPERALPLRPSSYELMRRTESLPPASVVPSPTGPCRLLPAPAGRRPFPTLPLRVFHEMPGSVPRRALGVHMPVASPHGIGLPLLLPEGRLPASSRQATSRRGAITGSSPFLTFRPPVLLATQVAPTARALSPEGRRGFSIRAERASSPARASDMLAARTRQLAAEDFHLLRPAAMSAAPGSLALPREPSCCRARPGFFREPLRLQEIRRGVHRADRAVTFSGSSVTSVARTIAVALPGEVCGA